MKKLDAARYPGAYSAEGLVTQAAVDDPQGRRLCLEQRRFGQRIRKLTAGCFLVLRALAEGVRVFAISIVVGIILGTGEVASIVLIVCLTLFYTFEGGMTAVIWTDVVQMFLYVGGAIVSLFVILQQVPGGWPHIVDAAVAADKFRILHLDFSWTMPYTFWAGLIMFSSILRFVPKPGPGRPPVDSYSRSHV